jgi:hypothetical protein
MPFKDAGTNTLVYDCDSFTESKQVVMCLRLNLLVFEEETSPDGHAGSSTKERATKKIRISKLMLVHLEFCSWFMPVSQRIVNKHNSVFSKLRHFDLRLSSPLLLGDYIEL